MYLFNLDVTGIWSMSTLKPLLDDIAIFFKSFANPSEISIHDDANLEISKPRFTRGTGFTKYFLKYL